MQLVVRGMWCQYDQRNPNGILVIQGSAGLVKHKFSERTLRRKEHVTT